MRFAQKRLRDLRALCSLVITAPIPPLLTRNEARTKTFPRWGKGDRLRGNGGRGRRRPRSALHSREAAGEGGRGGKAGDGAFPTRERREEHCAPVFFIRRTGGLIGCFPPENSIYEESLRLCRRYALANPPPLRQRRLWCGLVSLLVVGRSVLWMMLQWTVRYGTI